MKHTPGPWAIFSERIEHPNGLVRFVGQSNFDEDSVTNTDEIVCKLTDSENIRGNAALIAAAPDLLAACKAAHAELSRMGVTRAQLHPDDLERLQAVCLAAIARAESGGGA